MIRDKGFYREFFSLFVVLALQSIITLSVNLADNIMLGGYSEPALSGVAAVNQIQFIFQQILFAFGEGVVILGSQYFGKGDVGPLKRISACAMHFAASFAVLLFLAVTLFPRPILLAFTTDEEIIARGMEYLRTVRFTYLFFAVTQILLSTLRATGTVRIALVLSVCAFCINCGINYTLIYGHFGAPELGVTGAAIGTLVSRIAELAILLLYIIGSRNRFGLRPGDYLKTDAVLRRDYVRVTYPMLVVQGLWGVNTALQTVILGHMTARAIAANSVASTLYGIVKAMPAGSCGAAAIIIGRTIGEASSGAGRNERESRERLRACSVTIQVLFVLIGIAAGLTLYLIRVPILSLYRLEPETMKMADTFLVILSVVAATMSYQMPTNNGIIRGGGDTKFTMKLDLISIWCIVLPLSFLMAFVVKASPVAVVCCLNADQVFKCVPAFIKVNFGRWAIKLTR